MIMWMVRIKADRNLFRRALDRNVIAIGPPELGDLETFQSPQHLFDEVSTQYPNLTPRRKTNRARSLNLFSRAIFPGHTIVTYDRSERVYAVGQVIGQYKYDPTFDGKYVHLLDVKWLPNRVSRDDLSVRAKNGLSSGLELFPLSSAACEVVDKARNGTSIDELASACWKTIAYVSVRIYGALLAFHRAIRAAESYTLFFAVVGLLITALTMMLDLDDRTAERKFRAWQVIIDATRSASSSNDTIDADRSAGAAVSAGTPDARRYDLTSSTVYRESTEYLSRSFDGLLCYDWVNRASRILTGNHHRQCVFPKRESENLVGLAGPAANFSKSVLVGANLSASNYRRANFSGSNLTNVNFSESDLVSADFKGSDLTKANLANVNLSGADLEDAKLDHATLRNSYLIGAAALGARLNQTDLSGANLTDVSGLTQTQLDLACADEKNSPTIPEGLRWNGRPCPEWRGLRVEAESRCTDYSRRDYGFSIRKLGDDMPHAPKEFSPYTNRCFESQERTHVDHIVAISEAHDSGLCFADLAKRQRFVMDAANLTRVEPTENIKKGGKDAGEWLPKRNRCWFANRVVEVRLEYDLTVDRAEADALDDILKSCGSNELVRPRC